MTSSEGHHAALPVTDIEAISVRPPLLARASYTCCRRSGRAQNPVRQACARAALACVIAMMSGVKALSLVALVGDLEPLVIPAAPHAALDGP